MLSVCAAVVCRDGKILLATRRPGSRMAGKWEFPGGKVEPSETPAECIVRELREELGVDVEARRILWAVREAGPARDLLLQFVLCSMADGVEPVPQEGQRFGWFTPDELDGMDFAPADAEMVSAHREELSQLCCDEGGGDLSGR